jgi:hypothetical protein
MSSKKRKTTEPEGAPAFTPDEYDRIAEQRDSADSPPDPSPIPDPPPSAEPPAPDKPRARQPDPFELESIALGSAKDSPRMRLYRSNRTQTMAIQFDEKPDEKYLKMLSEAPGWRWTGPPDKVWSLRFGRHERWATQAEAEQLFRKIGNAIRTDLGLEATQSITR